MTCQKEWKMPRVPTLENRNKTHYVQDLNYMYFFRRVNVQFSRMLLNLGTSEEDLQQLQMFLWIWAAKKSVFDSHLWTWEQSPESLEASSLASCTVLESVICYWARLSLKIFWLKTSSCPMINNISVNYRNRLILIWEYSPYFQPQISHRDFQLFILTRENIA